jgi:uncharacterized cupredoxin-like copper-binding protein
MKLTAAIACILALAAPALAKAPPARLLVTAAEFRLSLSRATLKAGPAIIQLQNLGEDAHDLRLQRVGGNRVYRIATVQPGAVGELDATLLPGKFRLWCSLADHAALGMRTTLIVR